MAVAYRRSRMAGGFVLVSLLSLFAPLALADTADKSDPRPAGLLCTDEMMEDPFFDELEPTPIADTSDAEVVQKPALGDAGVCHAMAPVAV